MRKVAVEWTAGLNKTEALLLVQIQCCVALTELRLDHKESKINKANIELSLGQKMVLAP